MLVKIIFVLVCTFGLVLGLAMIAGAQPTNGVFQQLAAGWGIFSSMQIC